MLDKKKIEEAKEEIFDKEDFYLYSQEIENPNGKNVNFKEVKERSI